MTVRLHIDNLPQDASESDLKDIFSRYGAVSGIFLIARPETSFAFIDMEHANEAINARNELAQSRVLGAGAKIEISRTSACIQIIQNQTLLLAS